MSVDDNLASPEIGPISTNIAEGFRLPVVERPSVGSGEVVGSKIPDSVASSQDNDIDLANLRTAIRNESREEFFDRNAERTAQYMKANGVAEEESPQEVIVKESPVIKVLKIGEKLINSAFRRS